MILRNSKYLLELCLNIQSYLHLYLLTFVGQGDLKENGHLITKKLVYKTFWILYGARVVRWIPFNMNSPIFEFSLPLLFANPRIQKNLRNSHALLFKQKFSFKKTQKMVDYLLNIRVFGMFHLNLKVFKNFYLNLLSFFLLTDLNIM